MGTSASRKISAALLFPVLSILAVFFVLPILFVVGSSMTPDPGGGLSGLEAYRKLIVDPYYLMVFLQTFLFSSGITVCTLVFGYPIASFIARTTAPERSLVIFLVIAPLLISMVVKAYGWQLILGNQGIVNTMLTALGFAPVRLIYNWTGVVIATVHVLLPFAVISIAGVLSNLDSSIEESAAVLGASPVRVFFLVTIPLAINGLITAATFVFLLALGSFVTILMLGGNGTMVVPLLIYQQVTITYNQAFAASMATVLMAITLVLMFAQFRLLRRGDA
jgi:ABC-type spermidine/putrescine transport system permease subunit I